MYPPSSFFSFVTFVNIKKKNKKERVVREEHAMMAHTSTAVEIDRSISRFISRGNEIAKHEPTTSYYCKLRATELLMETKPRPDDLIRKLLEELEVRLFFYAFGWVFLFSLLSLCLFSAAARVE